MFQGGRADLLPILILSLPYVNPFIPNHDRCLLHAQIPPPAAILPSLRDGFAYGRALTVNNNSFFKKRFDIIQKCAYNKRQ